MKEAALLPFLFLAAACGSGGNDSASKLEEAAEQSDPAAAAVLENAADSGVAPQDALQQAGNAQAATVGQGQQPQQAPSTAGAGAKPHAPGDPVPPPKTESAPQRGAGAPQSGISVGNSQ